MVWEMRKEKTVEFPIRITNIPHQHTVTLQTLTWQISCQRRTLDWNGLLEHLQIPLGFDKNSRSKIHEKRQMRGGDGDGGGGGGGVCLKCLKPVFHPWSFIIHLPYILPLTESIYISKWWDRLSNAASTLATSPSRHHLHKQAPKILRHQAECAVNYLIEEINK